MSTIIIPAKMSGTGTIHDLASQHETRKIKIPANGYAVVLAAYYGGGTTTHRTWEAALKQSKKNKEFSHSIIDSDGYIIEPNHNNDPRRIGDPHEKE